MDARSHSIEIDGRRFAWRALGSGPPLVLVNGYAGSATDWDPTFLSVVADSSTVVCPDNRGMGDSELGDPAALSVDGMAADLERLLDGLEVDSVPVVGWSMGGFVAQRLATRAPGRVEALVLLSTDPGGSAAAAADPEVWRLLTDHTGAPRERASRLISLLFPAEVAPEFDRQFGDLVAQAGAGASLQALSAQEEAMAAWHAEEPHPAPAPSPPVLAMTGAEDVVIPPANLEALAAHWPGCRIERFAGGGHGFMAQEPQRLAELVLAFLGRPPAS